MRSPLLSVSSLVALSCSLVGAALLAPARAAEPAASVFDIPPYLFFDPTPALNVAWRPLGEPGATELGTQGPGTQEPGTQEPGTRRQDASVQLFKDGVRFLSITAERHGDLFRASLPMSCDVPGEFTYLVPGMPKPSAVGRPQCARVDQTVRFSFLTDTQQDTELVRVAAERIARRDSAFVLHGGDHVQYGGVDAQWRQYLRSIEPFAKERPIVPAAGNHEFFLDSDGENLAKFFAQARDHSWYRFSSGPVDILVLNSSDFRDRQSRNDQLAWLRAELARPAEGRWRIVVFHHPPFSLGIGYAAYIWTPVRNELLKYYVPVLEEGGADLVLNGHTHLFERSYKGGVHYLVGGAAGGIMGWFGGDNPFASFAHAERTVSHFEASSSSLIVITEDLAGNVLDELKLHR